MPSVNIGKEMVLPFDDRCEKARAMLVRKWNLLQKLKLEAMLACCSEAVRAVQKQTGGPSVDSQLDDFNKPPKKALWDAEIETTQRTYGVDATDFALKTIFPVGTGN